MRAVRIDQLPVEAQIRKVFGSDAPMALAVSQAENGTRVCNRRGAQNKNGTYDWGIFQINEIHLKKGYSLSDFQDCLKNIQIAKSIFDASGWNAWSAYKNGAYKRFLVQ